MINHRLVVIKGLSKELRTLKMRSENGNTNLEGTLLVQGMKGIKRTTRWDGLLTALGSLGIIALTGYLALVGTKDPINLPEEYVGFDKFIERGYSPNGVTIPTTEEDIIYVELIQVYNEDVEGDSMKLWGEFYIRTNSMAEENQDEYIGEGVVTFIRENR